MDLPNYATKADLNGATGADKSSLAGKSDLVDLKTKIGKKDIDKKVSGLAKKYDYNRNIAKNERKIPNYDVYTTTQEFNKLAKEDLYAWLKEGSNKTRHVEVVFSNSPT